MRIYKPHCEELESRTLLACTISGGATLTIQGDGGSDQIDVGDGGDGQVTVDCDGEIADRSGVNTNVKAPRAVLLPFGNMRTREILRRGPSFRAQLPRR